MIPEQFGLGPSPVNVYVLQYWLSYQAYERLVNVRVYKHMEKLVTRNSKSK